LSHGLVQAATTATVIGIYCHHFHSPHQCWDCHALAAGLHDPGSPNRHDNNVSKCGAFVGLTLLGGAVHNIDGPHSYGGGHLSQSHLLCLLSFPVVIVIVIVVITTQGPKQHHGKGLTRIIKAIILFLLVVVLSGRFCRLDLRHHFDS
jgi:hypothetical protein